MDATAAVCIIVGSLWLTSAVKAPRLAVAVRRWRPLGSLMLIHAWLIVRCLPVQPNASLLQLAMEQLVAWRLLVVDALQSSSLEAVTYLAPVVQWIWRLMEDALAYVLFCQLLRFLYVAYHYTSTEWLDWMVRSVFEWARDNVPGVQAAIESQTESFRATADQVLNKNPSRRLILSLPEQGVPISNIVNELAQAAAGEHQKWLDGKVSGTVYINDAEHFQLMTKVFGIYNVGNPLHPGIWPRLNQCEAEVIAMTADLLHGPRIGCLTSGGTESIILAIRAHLHVYGRRRGIIHPEIVCGTSAHAAVNKACDMFGIRQVSINIDDGQTYQLSPAAVRRRITSNTIMIYASAPTYPQGVVDPIAELAELAKEFNIGLHVDACLGGFVLPFCSDAPVFDFRLDGVTSMSADTHKYGYAAKGTSVVVYRDNDLRHGQYFSYPHWTGGMYVTPTIAGSRPGALAACAWAAMVSLGMEGYRTRVRKIVDTARAIAKGIAGIPELQCLTAQPFMVVCLASSLVDIYRIQDSLSGMGWVLNELQSPASIHVCVTLNMVGKAALFLRDLRTAVKAAKAEGAEGRSKGTAGIYGAVGALPDGPVECVLHTFTDMTLTP